MTVKSEQLFSRIQPKHWVTRTLQFPLTRLIITIAALIPAAIFHPLIGKHMIKSLEGNYVEYLKDLEMVFNFLLFIVSYHFIIKWLEKRPAYEISKMKSPHEIGAGFLIGAVLVFITAALILIFGVFRQDSLNSHMILFHSLVFFGFFSFIEELMFRGIFFRLTEEMLGSWAAILIIASFFGFAHYGNQNATVMSSVSILLADCILTGAFVLTRRLWLAWGIHWGWNWAQDGVLGMPNSGMMKLPSWMNTTVEGPIWLTGGDFGIELSVLGVLTNVVVGVIIIKIAINRGQLIKPMWMRKNEGEPVVDTSDTQQ